MDRYKDGRKVIISSFTFATFTIRSYGNQLVFKMILSYVYYLTYCENGGRLVRPYGYVGVTMFPTSTAK